MRLMQDTDLFAADADHRRSHTDTFSIGLHGIITIGVLQFELLRLKESGVCEVHLSTKGNLDQPTDDVQAIMPRKKPCMQ